MRNLKSLLVAAVAGLPLFAGLVFNGSAANAQSIDYGSLESLFGEPVTTSATGSPQRSTEVPVDMTIISADDIKHSGAHDLPTLLGRVPGLDVLNWSSQSADIGVRGYDQPMSPRLLVLVNGRQVYLDHYGYTAWSTIPVQLSEIRQIEVVKGPNAALFGFNAVSGVVNIITYNPKYDNVSGGSVSAASRNGSEASLVQTFHLTPKIAARLSAGASKQDEWDNTRNMTVNQYRARPSRATVNLDAVASLTDTTEMRFETSVSNTQQTDMISTFDSVATKYLTTSAKLDLTSDTKLGLLSATAYRNTLKSNIYLVYSPAQYDNTITDVKVQDLFKLGAKHTFRLGLESRHNELNTAPTGGAKISYDVTSASAMWAWAVSDRFSTSAALRSDNLSMQRSGTFPAGFPLADNGNWDRKISKISYNAGAVWRVSDKDTVRAMAARGAQLPSLIELGGLQLTVPYPGYKVAFLGNPFLQPSIVDNVELSYDHSFTAAKVSLRAFSQKTTNVKGQPSASELFRAPTLTSYPAVSWENVSDSKMSGFEVSASGKLTGNYHWSADYTGTNVKDTALGTHNVTARKAAYGIMTPDSRANANLGWSGGKWTIDGFVHHTSTFSTYAPGTYVVTAIPAYTTLAANVSYDLGHAMTVSVSGQNLTKAHQMQTAGLMVPPTVYVSLSKSW